MFWVIILIILISINLPLTIAFITLAIESTKLYFNGFSWNKITNHLLHYFQRLFMIKISLFFISSFLSFIDAKSIQLNLAHMKLQCTCHPNEIVVQSCGAKSCVDSHKTFNYNARWVMKNFYSLSFRNS
jgi:hypothetical protein